MARKKAGPKKPAEQPMQEASDKLLENLLGELKLTGAEEAATEATAPELLEALASTLEATPELEPVAEASAAEDTVEALAAMQSAMELGPLEMPAPEMEFEEEIAEPVAFATLSEAPLAADAVVESEPPECLPDEPALPLPAEEQHAAGQALAEMATLHAPEALAPAAEEELLPLLEETEAVVEAAAPAISRSSLVSGRGEETQAEDQPDILSRVVAGIDSQVARTPVWQGGEGNEDEAEEEASDAYASFRLLGSAYAVAVGAIREIDRATEITPVPHLPDFIRGVINLRGDVTCVLDLRSFIGLAPLEDHESGWLLVVSGAESRRTLALLVDEMSSLVRVPANKLKPPAGKVEDRVAPLLEGVVEQRDRVLGVLSVDSLLGSPDVRQLWM
ncbi:MAG: purine-binding chemotaxis protein CheW [Bryobacterales bacterium]|nr:purine-binding chemotaxis protein CheW [Bryobacterales bacterium]